MWPLSKDVTLTPIQETKCHLRKPGASTLWAVARGAYDDVQQFAFTISWPHGGVFGTDELCVAFDTRENAEEWHQTFKDAVLHLSTLEPAISVSEHPGAVDTVPNLPKFPRSSASKTGNMLNKPGNAPKQTSIPAQQSTSTSSRRAWASVLHINGVAVYSEEVDEDGEGGAVMVSAVVQAPPLDVFHNLVQERKTEGLGVFSGARTVEVLDATTQVVAQKWGGTGLIGALCAPREAVMLRTWRRDEDGTFIVLYQSTKHRNARPSSDGWGWKRPVTVDVTAAGFTIAPLLPRYIPKGAESPECLVTLVLKADLGGFLNERGLFSRMMGPIAQHAQRSLLEPVVTSIIILRDTVEQNRFVVRPLSGPPVRESDSFVASQKPAMMQRSTTMLAYKRSTTMREEQKLAATPPSFRYISRVEAPTAISEEEEGEMPVEETDAWAVAGTCKSEFWNSPGASIFKVRGPNYLADKKKMDAAPPMFELVAVDLLELEEPLFHIGRLLPSVKKSPAPFLFTVQLMVPAHPPLSLVATWAAPMAIAGKSAEDLMSEFELEQGPIPDCCGAFFRNFTDFIDGDGAEADAKRNKRFKLIPNIVQGSWLIKQSVGTTPVILGQKLTTKYARGKTDAGADYFEVDVDIGSSSVAASITNLVCGATRSLTLDMAILLEGQSGEHLPEQLIGSIRLPKIDLRTAAYLDDTTGKIIKPESK